MLKNLLFLILAIVFALFANQIIMAILTFIGVACLAILGFPPSNAVAWDYMQAVVNILTLLLTLYAALLSYRWLKKKNSKNVTS